jgi:hypothetical protein
MACGNDERGLRASPPTDPYLRQQAVALSETMVKGARPGCRCGGRIASIVRYAHRAHQRASSVEHILLGMQRPSRHQLTRANTLINRTLALLQSSAKGIEINRALAHASSAAAGRRNLIQCLPQRARRNGGAHRRTDGRRLDYPQLGAGPGTSISTSRSASGLFWHLPADSVYITQCRLGIRAACCADGPYKSADGCAYSARRCSSREARYGFDQHRAP